MAKELKKTCENKNISIALNKAIKLYVGRYGEQKIIFSDGLKVLKNDQNMGNFFALDRNNQKTWLEKNVIF